MKFNFTRFDAPLVFLRVANAFFREVRFMSIVSHVERCFSRGEEWIGVVRGRSFVYLIQDAVEAFCAEEIWVSSCGVGHKDMRILAGLPASVHVYAACGIVKMNSLRVSDKFDKGVFGQGVDLHMHRSHSKFAILKSGDKYVSLLTTANLTKNTRWESLIISPDSELAEFILDHLADLDRLGSEPWQGLAHYNQAYLKAFQAEPAKTLRGALSRWKNG
jgi:hypothetical protein